MVLIVTSILGVTSTTMANSTIKVPSDYPTIQEAINAAAPGDTIQVSAQTYNENLIVNKTVRLIGESLETTIIDGDGIGTVMDVYADDVYISGFTIRNSGLGLHEFYSGLHMHFSTSIVIVGNSITNNEFGIWLEGARNNVIRDNTITHNKYDAIYLGNSNINTISANTITNNTYGVWLENSSCYNVFVGNIITNSSKGIRLAGNSNNNAVYDNTLKDNDDGVDLSSSFNTIYENTLRDNFHGIYSLSSSDVGNILYRNNFINNTKQVFLRDDSLVEAWNNGLEGNYWSGYTGQDLNGDGIGDTDIPHQGFDWRPLMDPWSSFRIFNVTSNGENYVVTTLSNSTIASFDFNQPLAQISFNVTGPSRTLGFCNVTIPKALLKSEPPKNWSTTVDGINVYFIATENSTHTSLHFTYAHSTHMVQIRVMQIENSYPIADFTHSPTNPRIPETINFTDLSTDSDGNIVSWHWEFGDGNNSMEQNPRYKYTSAEQYVVTLIVEDDLGAQTATFKVISVRKVGTTLAINAPSTADRGHTLTITATLKDENENLVPNATIEFYLLKQGEWESIGSNETSTSGAALVSYTTLLAAGTYQLKAAFNGTQILAESSVTFTIEIMDVAGAIEGLPFWLIAICLALVITVAFVARFIRRKRQASPLKRKSAS